MLARLAAVPSPMVQWSGQGRLSLHSYPSIPLCYLRIVASTPLGGKWLFSEGAACLGDWTPVTECLCLGKWISPKVERTFSIQIWSFHLLPFGSVGSEPNNCWAQQDQQHKYHWAPLELSQTAEWATDSNFKYSLTHTQFLPILKITCLIFPNL